MYIVITLLIVVILGLMYFSVDLATRYRELENSYLDENFRRHQLSRAICEHRAKTRKDQCWQNDCDLWVALGDNDTEWPHGSYETKKAMRDGCRAYIDGCFDKD